MNCESIMDSISSIRHACLLADYGLLDQLLSLGYLEASDEGNFICYEMMHYAMDFVAGEYLEAFEVEKWYFSDASMMEYYRLCRLYGRAHGLKLQDNPYMRRADDFVDGAMDLGSYYGYGWTLLTKVGHQWASGIVLQTDAYFCGSEALLQALLEIRAWYVQAGYHLRRQLLEERILRLIALPAHVEDAA